jgi:hypothetical protein
MPDALIALGFAQRCHWLGRGRAQALGRELTPSLRRWAESRSVTRRLIRDKRNSGAWASGDLV